MIRCQPSEDRKAIQDIFTVEESGEDVLLVSDSDEEHLPVDHRSIQGQRSSRMKLLHAEPDAPASEGQADIAIVGQYGPQQSIRIIKGKSVTSYASSTSSLETIPESPATSSLQGFESVEQIEEVEQVGEEEEADQVDQKDQEALSSSSDSADVGYQSQLPQSIIWYINRREVELMKKFQQHVEEMTQMLQGEIHNQSHALETLKGQLQAMQDSEFQMQPSSSRHIHGPEPQSLEPVPKKQCTELRSRSFPDPREAKHFCASCSSHPFQFPEELKQACVASFQQPAQELVQCLPQQEVRPQEQSQQHVTVENPVLQILLPGEPDLSLPLDSTQMFMPAQPVTLPIQVVAEQQLSSHPHGENPEDQEDRSRGFLPEGQVISSTVIPQLQISSNSSLVTLQIPEDYMQLWQQPQDPQHHLYLQVNTWPSSEQVALQDQVTWIQQALTPEAEIQGSSGLQTFQDQAEYEPDQICYFMSGAQSNLHE
nr:circadian clock protein PASD1 [Kogia breviceps]